MPVRKAPTSIKDYLKSLSEVLAVIQWIRKEVMNEKSKRHIRWMFVLSFFVILCQSLMPALIGNVFSGVVGHSLIQVLIGIVGGIGCLYVQKFFERHMSKNREWMLYIHWGNMDRRMSELFSQKSPGQHIQETILIPSGIDKGRWGLLAIQGLIFFEAMPAINQIIISLLLLLYLSFVAGGLMIIAVCGYILYSMYMNYHVLKTCTPIDRSIRRLNRRRYERMEKVLRVITSGQQDREVGEMTEWFNREGGKDCVFWIWFIEHSTWRSFINISLFGAVVAYGAYLAWEGVWQVGILYPLFSWSTRIIENIWHLADVEQKINWNLPSINHMIKALSLPPDIVDDPNAILISASVPQPISIKGVSHSYPPEKPFVADDEEDPDEGDLREEEPPHTLKGINFTIEPGEKVALLGPSGAGKTTLMRLLLRFRDPKQGSISVGGTDLRMIVRDSWLRCIGYIAQHPEVFDGTIRDNLTYRLTDAERANFSDEELWRLMRDLEIDFGKRLDKGLDTRVGKHGLKLSGGQAQRLMIGAAVIGNPWFMVIDEATSSLDSTTERKVQAGLQKILSRHTSALIVAHRLSTVRELCTKFVILRPANEVPDEGSQVEAIGSSFEELYETSPTFRALADDQEIVIRKVQAV